MLTYKNLKGIAANTTHYFDQLPHGVNGLCVKVDGTFGGCTLIVGCNYDQDLSNGLTQQGVFISASKPVTTNSQFSLILGKEVQVVVKVSGATASTNLWIEFCPQVMKVKQ